MPTDNPNDTQRIPFEPDPEPPPRKLLSPVQLSALLAILLATVVPVAWVFGVDLCAVTRAVGVQLDACVQQPVVAPSPRAPVDAGAPR